MKAESKSHLILAGAALDTGNLGVTALGLSAITGLLQRGASITVLDNGVGSGPLSVPASWQNEQRVSREGAWYSRRVWRAESLVAMDLIARVGRVSLHPRLQAWRDSDALVDLSGGDSFSDTYGERRFRAVIAPKILASRLGLPVVLLPQTYGPFHSLKLRRQATEIVATATQCWARDERGFDELRSLLGSSFDPNRHRLGVDVAFALPMVAPHSQDELFAWMDGDAPTVGINVSGLVASAGTGVSGLAGPAYLRVVADFVAWAVECEYQVLLIPHVVGRSTESDLSACRRVLSLLPDMTHDHVRVLAGLTHPGEVKHVISNLAWFTGARMHSTIASLSRQVPTFATAYSGKFLGVFAMCGVPDSVVDLRRTPASELLGLWQESVLSRDHARRCLRQHVPNVVKRAELQFDDIVSAIGGQ